MCSCFLLGSFTSVISTSCHRIHVRGFTAVTTSIYWGVRSQKMSIGSPSLCLFGGMHVTHFAPSYPCRGQCRKNRYAILFHVVMLELRHSWLYFHMRLRINKISLKIDWAHECFSTAGYYKANTGIYPGDVRIDSLRQRIRHGEGGGTGRPSILLALVIRRLTTHPFRDEGCGGWEGED